MVRFFFEHGNRLKLASLSDQSLQLVRYRNLFKVNFDVVIFLRSKHQKKFKKGVRYGVRGGEARQGK